MVKNPPAVWQTWVRCQKTEVERFYEDLQDLLELTPPKRSPFHHRDWNAKVGSQEIAGITGKLAVRVQNEVRQRLREFFQENTLVIANILFQQYKRQHYIWTLLLFSH